VEVTLSLAASLDLDSALGHAALRLRERGALDLRLRAEALFLLSELERSAGAISRSQAKRCLAAGPESSPLQGSCSSCA
jgi:hypothetical protein